MKWTVGVITAPRSADYLSQCLGSLKNAGWDSPIVFAEPGSSIPAATTSIVRRKTYGDWTNWATGLFELLLSEPNTDYFLMAEDDAVVCAGAKHYLEHVLPQLGEFASLSLYTPSVYHKPRFVGFHNELGGHRTWSTVTVVMHRQKAISFFSDPDVQRHRFENIFDVEDGFWSCNKVDPQNSIKDAVIGQWAAKHCWPVYYHTPSLAQHIGVVSTITDEDSTIENGRQALDFVGCDADLGNLINGPVNVRRHVQVPLC